MGRRALLSAAVADAQNLDRQVEATLRSLYETTPAARELAGTAKGILIFPEIARDNYVLGLQSGHAYVPLSKYYLECDLSYANVETVFENSDSV